jgi:D-alanyl-D-alanine carboxypeptidase
VKTTPVLVAVAVAFAAAGGLGWYRYAAAVDAAAAADAARRAEIASSTAALETARTEIAQLAEQLAAEKEANDELAQEKRKAEKKADELEDLAKLDPELLAKYSKVYFLNENYEPPKVVAVPVEYRADPDKDLKIHKEVSPFLRRMLEAAEDDKVEIAVASAYRSFDQQAELKGQYSVTYGTSAANRFSADQGYSEHQLGTTIDFTSPEIGGGLNGFEGTEAFGWLEENAHRYGFILSYPEGNAYYAYEPWHWRFVGEDLARHLKKKKLSFYDMDQRDIDSYLGEIFD